MAHYTSTRMLARPPPAARSKPSGRSARHLLQLLMLLVLAATPLPSRAARQLPAPLTGPARPVIEQLLASRTAGLAGKVEITINTPLSGALPSCQEPEAFLPAHAKLWGRVSVGVRCTSDRPWVRYVPAYVAVLGRYHVAARDISAGHPLVPADTRIREGDLTALPASVLSESSPLIGMRALNSIAIGAPIRRELLRGVMVVQQGQTVKVVSRGAGFVVSSEGQALTDASLGSVIRVKMRGGQLLSGVVGPNGVVERSL
jgi:flagella basal body P-ring formation protein FlgA